jgi:hypothetical protein
MALLLVALATAAGCGETVSTDAINEFSTGVSQARQQSGVAVKDANKLAREASIRYVLASTQPGLSEDRFVTAVEPDDIARWDNAFAGMQSYCAAIQNLLSPDKSTAFEDAAIGFAKELKEGHAATDLPPGVAAAFTQIGETVIAAAQQHAASTAMRRADPHVRDALTSMAKAIGEDPRGKRGAAVQHVGLMGTVYTNWESALGPSRIRFAVATTQNNADERQAAITEFMDVLDRRDAELDALASLRQSLLLLADAHSAAARGQKQDADSFIALISQQLQQTQALFEKFKQIHDEPVKPK